MLQNINAFGIRQGRFPQSSVEFNQIMWIFSVTAEAGHLKFTMLEIENRSLICGIGFERTADLLYDRSYSVNRIFTFSDRSFTVKVLPANFWSKHCGF